jgi:putative transposase
VREVIATMAQDNPWWGSERIRGELLKLGVTVSTRSIRRSRWRPLDDHRARPLRTCVRNHAHAIGAADLCVVQSLTFETLSVLLFISHGRRELGHLAVTARPTAAGVWRHLVEATT